MKIVKIIKKIIARTLMIVFFAFAIIMAVLILNRNDYGVTQFDDTSLLLIKEEISSDKYQKGDLVIVEGKRINNVNLGDELFVYQLDDSGVVRIDLGVVGQIHSDDDIVTFENGSAYDMDLVVGKPSKTYNKLGMYLSIILAPWGFLFVVVVPSFLIFLYQIYALIVEIKYGSDNATDKATN